MWFLLALACSSPGGGAPDTLVTQASSPFTVSGDGIVAVYGSSSDSSTGFTFGRASGNPPNASWVRNVASTPGRYDTYPAFDDEHQLMVGAASSLYLLHSAGVVLAQHPLPGEATSRAADTGAGWAIGHVGGLSLLDDTGAVVATAELDTHPQAGLMVGSDGVLLGVGQDDDGAWTAFAVEPTGDVRWTVPIPEATTAPALAEDDTLVVTVHTGETLTTSTTADQAALGLSALDGSERYRVALDSFAHPPVITADNEAVVVGLIDEFTSVIIAFDASSGDLHAQSRIDGLSGAPILDDEERLWFGCEGGICVRSTSGRDIGFYEAEGGTTLPPALWDGLLVANMSGSVVSWYLDAPWTTATDGWPRIGGNGAGTGRGWGR